MLSLQPEQCAEECPSPAPPARVTRTSLSPAGTAGSAHARGQCQGQLGTSAEPQDVPWSSRSSSWFSPGHALWHCGPAPEPSHPHLPARPLELCDMLFVCK